MAKDKKIKIPKRIAGVKVPKKVRRTAKQALEMADNPLALELAAAALTAAAGALKKRSGEGPKRQAAATAEDVEGPPREPVLKLRDMIAVAALDGARRLLDETPNAGKARKPKRAAREPASAAPEDEAPAA